MAVSNTVIKNIYILNKSTTTFSYTFDISNSTDIHLFLYNTNTSVETEITSGFTVDTTAKTVTWNDAVNYDNTYKLTLSRETILTQLLTLINGGSFFAEDIMAALDKLTYITQEQAEALNRSVKVQISDITTPDELMAKLNEEASNAETAASTAGSAATAAAASQTAAKQSETNAAGSESNANNSAIMSAASATASATSASDAKSAAMTAAMTAAQDVLAIAHQRQNNITYSIGDIAYSPNLPSWARIECVVAGETAMTETVWPTTAGQLVTDGTVKWIVDDVRDGNQVGDIVGKLYVKTGYIKANGSAVNRADYPRLFKFATDYSLFYDDGTKNITGTTTVNSTTVTGISTTDIIKLWIGMTITGTGIAANTTVTAINTTSITISNAATAPGTSVTLSYGNINNFPALFGNGDGNITFVLPDWRGAFLRFLDDGKGYDINRMLGSYQQDINKAHSHQFSTIFSGNFNGGANYGWIHDSLTSSTGGNTSYSGGIESRPKNIAIYPLIKY